jgi:hypothetical protein
LRQQVPSPETIFVVSEAELGKKKEKTTRAGAAGGAGGREAAAAARHRLAASNRSGILTYAYVCSRMMTYADVCSRMLTYADVCGWKHSGQEEASAAAHAPAQASVPESKSKCPQGDPAAQVRPNAVFIQP